MTSRKKRLAVFAVILTAATASGFVYYRYWHQQEAAANEIVLYGSIDIRQVDLAFDAADRIVEIGVVEGERVQRGQLLATLDSRERKLAVERAKAELLKSQHNLASAEYLYHDIAAARKQNPGTVSGLQHDQARAEVNSLQALFAVNESQLALAEKKLSDAFLHAPADAVVQTRILEPGAMATPERAVLTLALIDPIWARVFVDEPDLGRVSEGMRAYVTTDSYPGKRYPGWLGFISPVAEFTPKTVQTPEIRTDLVYQARIYVCNPKNELRLGMPVTAHIPFDQPTESLTKATACSAK